MPTPKIKNDLDTEVITSESEVNNDEQEQSTLAPIAPEHVIKENESLRAELNFIKELVLSQNKERDFVEKQTANIQHDVPEVTKLQKPKRILFTLNAVPDESARYEDGWIPGKALVGEFLFIDNLKSNEDGTAYVTGLDYEDIDEESTGLFGDALAAYQNEVKIARAWLENKKKVSLRSDNVNFWRKRRLKVDGLDRIYDTDMSEDILMAYYNIMGGGFSTIARSYEEAKSNPSLVNTQKLYISVQEEEIERNFSSRRASIKANALLEDIMDNWTKENALYLMYYLPIKKQLGYTLDTPKSHIIDQLANFIEGVDTVTDKKKRPQEFIDAVKMFDNPITKDDLRIKALFKAADFYGFVNFNTKDRLYKNRVTGFDYGNRVETAVELLKNPKNIEELSWLKSKVKEKWSK